MSDTPAFKVGDCVLTPDGHTGTVTQVLATGFVLVWLPDVDGFAHTYAPAQLRPHPTDCRHGERRQCETCELADEVAGLKELLKDARDRPYVQTGAFYSEGVLFDHNDLVKRIDAALGGKA